MYVSISGLFGLIFYTIAYMIQTLIFFICLLFIRDKSTGFLTIKISDLKHLLASNKLLSYIFAINLFSMAGLPPLLGFFSKFYIFVILIQNNAIYTIILLIIMSCISTFYYIRIVQALFFNTNSKPKFYCTIPYWISLILVLLTIINIFFCCFSWLFLDIINATLLNLFLIDLNMDYMLPFLSDFSIMNLKSFNHIPRFIPKLPALDSEQLEFLLNSKIFMAPLNQNYIFPRFIVTFPVLDESLRDYLIESKLLINFDSKKILLNDIIIKRIDNLKQPFLTESQINYLINSKHLYPFFNDIILPRNFIKFPILIEQKFTINFNKF